ncbi:MAG: ABC transporter ATP-binding protein [Anaerobacillus sp.]|uniref:ABC transporter ATP-binding protein n=1 Tax=Anaerobacillus sp. TaxID=1872506 RepID=UPI00391CB95D
MTAAILQLNDVSIQNKRTGQQLLKSVSVSINPGEMVALVGESGSGKSITASLIMGLLPRQLQLSGGVIFFQGEKIDQLPQKLYRKLRGREMSMIFQDYNGSLTPFIKIGDQMVETLQVHEKLSKKAAKEQALAALHQVKLPEKRVFDSYPFQLSGGQKQRAAIAMAIMLKPALIIADEPTTALDVITGEKILELIKELQLDLQCGVLLISHHLGEVLKWSDRVAVMYGGRLVEEGLTKEIGQHPYTDLLLRSRPQLTNEREMLKMIPGEPGSISLQGCPFANRCPKKVNKCHEDIEEVFLKENHRVSCHLLNETNYKEERLL